MCSAPTPVPAASDATTDAARTYEVHFEPAFAQTPDASRSQAQQDTPLGRGEDSLATRVNSDGFVDAVIPRRRGADKKLVLTRELLESHYHEPLDTVADRLGISKTTIKAACRRLGLPKWPFTHKGPRKRRMGVPKPEQPDESEHARTLMATFHEIMGNTDKRQRVGEEHMAPSVTLGVPLTYQPPGATLSYPFLQPMQMQSVSALSAMVTALGAADQQLALSPAVQGHAFSGQFPGQPPSTWMPVNPEPSGDTTPCRTIHSP
jgi:hypothetical protein